MKWMSELLLPVSRGKPGKIRDRGLGRIVQGGYALWNPNDGTVILTPMGKELYSRAEKFLLNALSGFPPQPLPGMSLQTQVSPAMRFAAKNMGSSTR